MARARVLLIVLLAIAGGVAAFAVLRGGAEPHACAAPASTAPRPPAATLTTAAPATSTASSATAKAPPEFGEAGPIPKDSSLALPPLMRIDIGGRSTSGRAQRAVLASPRLALAPAAARAIRSGRASAGALELLLRLRRPHATLLVFAADARGVRVQATTLRATRDLVVATRADPAAHVTLQPVRPEFADVGASSVAGVSKTVGVKAAAAALTKLGIPYAWGGGDASGATYGTCDGYHGAYSPCPASSTLGFDCSGLTLYAYAQVGIQLDHYAAFQWLEGKRIAVPDLAPGDLVFFEPGSDGPGHVGMYLGGGSFVQAPHTGDVVKISPLADYAGSYMGAVRPYG